MYDGPRLESDPAAGDSIDVDVRVVVAPSSGRFRPLPPEVFTTEGEWAQEGQVLAEIRSNGEVVPVRSRFSGWVMGMLARPGEPVSNGDALFWIRP